MLNFEITPKITKELLLSKFSQETIFCHYLGINNISKKLIRSPIRDDKNPTCGFYKNNSGNLILHDFATGEYFNCFSFVMRKYVCSYHEALNIIAMDFGLIKRNNKPAPVIRHIPTFKEEKDKITYIQIEMGEFTEQDLKWWSSFGISKKTLNKYKVYPVNTVFLNGNPYIRKAQHNPIYGYYFGKKDGIEQWRIYCPQNKRQKFLGNVSTKTVQGYKQLPESGKILVITKSQKDCMVFYELGIPAIAPNSETQMVSDKMLEELHERFKYIVLLYDNDATGVSFTNKIRKKHSDLIPLLIPKSTKCKDISDFYKMYGKIETKKLINSGINYIKQLKNEGKYQNITKTRL